MLLTWLDESVIPIFLVLLLQEWVPIEADHPVGYTATAKLVADGFRHKQYNLRYNRLGDALEDP